MTNYAQNYLIAKFTPRWEISYTLYYEILHKEIIPEFSPCTYVPIIAHVTS